MKNILLLTAMTLMVFSCNNQQETPTVEPVKPITKVYKFKWNNKSYTKYLVRYLKRSNLLKTIPSDIKEFGPMKDPITWWGNILAEMAYYESSWDPKVKYLESSGRYSRGLFQLSAVDGRRYKCNFNTQKSVHQVRENIQCAVLIMEKLVGQDGRIQGKINGKWQGGSRYWSVLRDSPKGKKSYSNIMRVNR